MATVFWETRGKIPIHYLQKGRSNTGYYHANLLYRFNDEEKTSAFGQKESTRPLKQCKGAHVVRSRCGEI